MTSRSDRRLGVVHVERAHHAGVCVSQEDGMSVQQRSVTSTLGGLVEHFYNRLNYPDKSCGEVYQLEKGVMFMPLVVGEHCSVV